MVTYRITELGRRFGLSRSTLLYYDREGLLHPSERSEADYRIYTQADHDKLERICFFRNAGLGLRDIAMLLNNTPQEGLILERRLRAITQEMNALKAQQRLLAGMLTTAVAGPQATGLDRDLWLSLQEASQLDEAASRRWHTEFERRAPAVHHRFLLGLGLSEKESTQVRLLTKSVKDNAMNMHYFFELFEDLPRQGPGCEAATLKALSLLTDLPPHPSVLDVGCGSGKQTLTLAQQLSTRVLAIDNHKPVLAHLERAAAQLGVDIETQEMSMIDMPFPADSFDLLWAEGSIFIIGLVKGLRDFRQFLKPGGYVAFTELCWFTEQRPAEIEAYFAGVYPDIRTISNVAQLATDNGYRVLDTFQLPDSAWWDDYYTPMQLRLAELKRTHKGVPEAEAVYAACDTEMEMFRRHSQHYGYAFFILEKTQEPN